MNVFVDQLISATVALTKVKCQAKGSPKKQNYKI